MEDGRSLDEFARRFPFMKVSKLARVLESDDPVRAQWDWLLHDPVFSGGRELLEAACSVPVMGSLFPDLSHSVLKLTVSWGSREPWVDIAFVRGVWRVRAEAFECSYRELSEALVEAVRAWSASAANGPDS
ncbi:hypothetical protein [Actinomadura parmotrematis]|uniref:Uncharacterized protein n=1 Tax=Actinomadura parmotrematis TaxID=2864039 RepID=A0ABS7FSN3_9ACTN|nr:hypothetical protein [Actinomadura parmotrematis]MBW8482528.1 hypothetical protein [Actinomadura parmotrematis]